MSNNDARRKSMVVSAVAREVVKPCAHMIRTSWSLSTIAVTTLALAVSTASAQGPTVGAIERIDVAFDALVAPGATNAQPADGFDWAEGPVWQQSGGYLLFSDVPRNTIYKWQEGAGLNVYLRPSGYDGPTPPFPDELTQAIARSLSK